MEKAEYSEGLAGSYPASSCELPVNDVRTVSNIGTELTRKLQDEVEIIEMCLPVFNDAGGIWFRNNHNMADGHFKDWGAARAFATAARAFPELLRVVTELANASQSEATSRLRNMAQSAIAMHDPGRPVPHHGSGPDNQ